MCLLYVSEYSNNSDFNQVILASDLNADFSRNTPFVRLVRERFQLLGIQSVWNNVNIDFTFMHTQTNADGSIRSNCSTIDHFAFNEELLENIHDAGLLHLQKLLKVTHLFI